ncbi:MAG: hypothetical protein HY376_02930 [Candidatus Blackburnbacteria bacterium]|nr:hypothetical protein [Candidatus Blackburnbacteria bacterium]
MARFRGWGSFAKGRFYTIYEDRLNRKGKLFVDGHSGRIFRSVRKVGNNWEGVGYVRTEPPYANLSGSDKNITYTPKLNPIKLRKIVLRGPLGPRASRTVLEIKRPKPAVSAL